VPVAVKPQPPVTVEELPEMQLPRAEHVRPERKDYAPSVTLEIPWRLVAVAAVVIVLGIILWARRSHNANTASIATNTVQAKNAPQPVSTTASVNQPSAAAALATGAATPARPSTPASQPANHPPAPASTALAASEKSEKKDPEKKTDDKSDATVRTPAKTNSKPAKPAPVLTLLIRATETSWISIMADGQPASRETLIAPAHTSVRASREIVARVGNAAGVTFLWNGKEIPANGAESEVKTFVFDANGMHVVSTAQPPGQNQ
jgi:cytoskeletal protein RodZ